MAEYRPAGYRLNPVQKNHSLLSSDSRPLAVDSPVVVKSHAELLLLIVLLLLAALSVLATLK